MSSDDGYIIEKLKGPRYVLKYYMGEGESREVMTSVSLEELLEYARKNSTEYGVTYVGKKGGNNEEV